MSHKTLSISEGEITLAGYSNTKRIDIMMESKLYGTFVVLTVNQKQSKALLKELRRVIKEVEEAQSSIFAAIDSKGKLISY